MFEVHTLRSSAFNFNSENSAFFILTRRSKGSELLHRLPTNVPTNNVQLTTPNVLKTISPFLHKSVELTL